MRNGKRILSLALLVLLVVLLTPVAAHADPPKGDTHLHSWSVVSETPATCTSPGTKTWRCSACGDTYTEQTSPPLGHDFGNGRVTREATCTKEGEKTWTCSRCDKKKTDTFPAKGHSPVSIPAVAATCTATGLTEGSQCSVCKEILKAQETVPAMGHTPAAIPAVAATCTETGLTEGEKCSICGEILKAQETVAATGHAWSDWATQIEATCTDGGIEIRTCLSCGTEETRSTDALGHAPVTVPGSDPTCETDGYTDGETCDRCGFVLKEREVLPAIGHEWDEGQVTREPQDFTPGVRTFTCKHDPSHTRTEEIDPAPWLFATFTGSIPDFTTFDLATKDLTPLTITEQPVGGSITRYSDETVPLHVAATGGVGEYTYQWYSQRLVSFHTFGLSSYNWPSAVGDNSPDYAADIGLKKYFCVVTDEAGNTAASEYANVEYKISIAKQPDNANLQPTGKATLSCEAADGSGSYSYRWIDNQDNEIDVGSSIDVTEVGDYMCIATDDQTGETASSYVATVYDTEPFTLVYLTGDCEYSPDNSGILVSEFKGGVMPYEIWWDKDGEECESYPAEVNENYGSVIHDATVGTYTVHATDAMGAVITATCHYTAPKLTIVEQPKGDTIPKDGYKDISVSVSDGEAPYRFVLYRNGEYYTEVTKDTASVAFSVWYSGNYYFHIEDSKGRSVDSDEVTFEDAVFRFTKQSNAGVLYTATDTFTLYVEVEGGVEPYTYEWMQYRGDTPWYTKASDTDTCIAKQPGKYACLVTDATGDSIHSKNMFVLYNGSKPRIIKQPSGLTLTPDEKGHFSFSLSCEAASGNGDESCCLEYRWERYNPDGYWSYAGSEKTMTHSLLGSYRCKVIDVISKEYTYTQTVTVAEAVTASVNAHSIPNSSYAAYYLNITGGTAPYTVKIYVVYAAYHADTGFVPSKTVLWRTYMVNTEEEAKDFYREVPHTYSYPYYEDGQWKYGWNYLKSYAIITDAGGRTTRVDIE